MITLYYTDLCVCVHFAVSKIYLNLKIDVISEIEYCRRHYEILFYNVT